MYGKASASLPLVSRTSRSSTTSFTYTGATALTGRVINLIHTVDLQFHISLRCLSSSLIIQIHGRRSTRSLGVVTRDVSPRMRSACLSHGPRLLQGFTSIIAAGMIIDQWEISLEDDHHDYDS